jgi:hypothetical protein
MRAIRRAALFACFGFWSNQHWRLRWHSVLGFTRRKHWELFFASRFAANNFTSHLKHVLKEDRALSFVAKADEIAAAIESDNCKLIYTYWGPRCDQFCE